MGGQRGRLPFAVAVRGLAIVKCADQQLASASSSTSTANVSSGSRARTATNVRECPSSQMKWNNFGLRLVLIRASVPERVPMNDTTLRGQINLVKTRAASGTMRGQEIWQLRNCRNENLPAKNPYLSPNIRVVSRQCRRCLIPRAAGHSKMILFHSAKTLTIEP